MSDTIVELMGATKSFGGFTALRGIDLAVHKGEFLTLLGPSGCGKTTTLRLIAGFERPDSGRIVLESVDVVDVPPNRRDVNTVFQSYALFPHLTVWENVAFGLKMRGTSRAEIQTRVSEALGLVQLATLGERKPAELSGGQQQRVALARALVCRPKVLLLDEPLASLDLQLRRRMQVELKHLQQRVGITFIFVTHDQEEALTVSDRIAVMDSGVIEQLDSPKEVYDNPSSLFVAQFIGETNLIKGRVLEVTPNGGVVAETTLGRVVLPISRLRPLGSVPTSGMPLTLSVRPERLRLQESAVDASTLPQQGRFTATCTEVTFLGSSVKSSFTTTLGGHAADALLPVGELKLIPRVGEVYDLGFGSDECMCFLGTRP